MKRTKPLYLLSGCSYHHRKTRDPLIREVFRETGKSQPVVAYIGTASGDDPAFYRILGSLFHRSGAGRVELAPLHASDADLRHSRRVIEQADVIFLSEGDVDLGMQVLRDRSMATLLRERYEDGVVFSGFSAGSILLSRQWVRWSDPDNDASAEPFDCLEIAPLICDTHGEADGWQELKTLLRLRGVPGEIGYGIPTSMGLRVHADGRVDAIGGAVQRYAHCDGRVDNLGDIAPAFEVHASEYEYQI